jgi:Fic family protein
MLFATPPLSALDLEVIERVLDLRRELRFALAARRRWTGALRRVAFAQAIQSSNSIEGYHVSLTDAVAAAAGDDPVEAQQDAVAWQAVTHYRQAMTYVLQLSEDEHFRYSPELLKSLHFMMVAYDLSAHPSRWRPGAVYVHDTASGEAVYEGPDAVRVPGLVDELMDVLNQDDDAPALARAAMAHLNFVMIHPFKDGNGRMARCLQSLVLAREGILAPEFASIEEYLGVHTRDYYDVLAQVGGGRWQPERDATPWLRFCLTAHYRQARTFLRRNVEAGRVWTALSEQVQAADLEERAVGPVFLAASGTRLRNETYRRVAEVTTSTASRDLKALVAAGLLEAHGEKRGRYYTAADWVRDQRRSARERIRAEDRRDPYRDGLDDEDPYAQPPLPEIR